MKQSILSVKIDPKLKKEVQTFADHVGLSVSDIVKNQLRQVLRERRVSFEEELVPNAKFAKELREIEEDIKAGRNIVGPFDSVDDLMKSLLADED